MAAAEREERQRLQKWARYCLLCALGWSVLAFVLLMVVLAELYLAANRGFKLRWETAALLIGTGLIAAYEWREWVKAKREIKGVQDDAA